MKTHERNHLADHRTGPGNRLAGHRSRHLCMQQGQKGRTEENAKSAKAFCEHLLVTLFARESIPKHRPRRQVDDETSLQAYVEKR